MCYDENGLCADHHTFISEHDWNSYVFDHRVGKLILGAHVAMSWLSITHIVQIIVTLTSYNFCISPSAMNVETTIFMICNY